MTDERKEYIITKVEKNNEKSNELKKQIRIRKIFIALLSTCVLLNAGSVVANFAIGNEWYRCLFNVFSGSFCGLGLYGDIKTMKRQELEKQAIEIETEALINECKALELEKTLGLK